MLAPEWLKQYYRSNNFECMFWKWLHVFRREIPGVFVREKGEFPLCVRGKCGGSVCAAWTVWRARQPNWMDSVCVGRVSRKRGERRTNGVSEKNENHVNNFPARLFNRNKIICLVLMYAAVRRWQDIEYISIGRLWRQIILKSLWRTSIKTQTILKNSSGSLKQLIRIWIFNAGAPGGGFFESGWFSQLFSKMNWIDSCDS